LRRSDAGFRGHVNVQASVNRSVRASHASTVGTGVRGSRLHDESKSVRSSVTGGYEEDEETGRPRGFLRDLEERRMGG